MTFIMAMPTTNVHGIWLYGRQTIHLTLTHYSRCGTLAALIYTTVIKIALLRFTRFECLLFVP
jgi:hypothetical protein